MNVRSLTFALVFILGTWAQDNEEDFLESLVDCGFESFEEFTDALTNDPEEALEVWEPILEPFREYGLQDPLALFEFDPSECSEDDNQNEESLCNLPKVYQNAIKNISDTLETLTSSLIDNVGEIDVYALVEPCEDESPPSFCHLLEFQINELDYVISNRDTGEEGECSLYNLLTIISDPETYLKLIGEEMMECEEGSYVEQWACQSGQSDTAAMLSFTALLNQISDRGLSSMLLDDDIDCSEEDNIAICAFQQIFEDSLSALGNAIFPDNDDVDFDDIIDTIDELGEQISADQLLDALEGTLDCDEEGNDLLCDSDSAIDDIRNMLVEMMDELVESIGGPNRDSECDESGENNDDCTTDALIERLESISDSARVGAAIYELATMQDNFFVIMQQYPNPDLFCENYEDADEYLICGADGTTEDGQMILRNMIGGMWNPDLSEALRFMEDIFDDQASVNYLMHYGEDFCEPRNDPLPVNLRRICEDLEGDVPEMQGWIATSIKQVSDTLYDLAPAYCLVAETALVPLLIDSINGSISDFYEEIITNRLDCFGDIDLAKIFDIEDLLVDGGLADAFCSCPTDTDDNEDDDSDIWHIVIIIILIIILVGLIGLIYLQLKLMRIMMRQKNSVPRPTPPGASNILSASMTPGVLSGDKVLAAKSSRPVTPRRNETPKQAPEFNAPPTARPMHVKPIITSSSSENSSMDSVPLAYNPGAGAEPGGESSGITDIDSSSQNGTRF